MKIRLRAFCAASLLLAFPPHFTTRGLARQSARDGAYERLLPAGFTSVTIENASGRTLVETWNGLQVSVVATRRAGADGGDALARRVSHLEVAPSALKIAVRPERQNDPVDLSVYVPRHVALVVRGGAERVVIKGAAGPVTVETDAGGISLHLPATAGADISVRAIEGTITSKLPLVLFGPFNAHALDGRTGQGGTPVIIRSARGAVELAPDDPARLPPAADDGRRAERAVAYIGSGPHRVPVPLAALMREAARSRNCVPAEAASSTAVTSASGPNATDADRAAPRAGGPEGDDEVESVKVRTVTLNARVTDAAGRLIPDLSKEDFQVFEGDAEQEIVNFEPVTAPVSLVLLLDLSGSTKDRMKVMRKAAKKFIESLKPNTRIAVAAFTRKFLLVSDFTDDRKLLKKRIDDVKNLNSGTAFYDSVWATLDLFKKVREKRKAVVVLSDGVDNSLSYDDFEPCHTFDELLSRVTREDVTIYPIYFDTEYEVTVKRRGRDTHEAYVTARKQLQSIADDTGGTLFKAERAEDLESVYERVASELHTLYSVAYNPSDRNYDGKWRNVSVRVKGGRGAARTRRGYYAR